MSDGLPETEFGGKLQDNGFFPPPHVMRPHEKLRSIYLTGDDTGQSPLEPAYFEGLLPFEEQYALREAEGLFDGGQYDPMKTV